MEDLTIEQAMLYLEEEKQKNAQLVIDKQRLQAQAEELARSNTRD